MSNNMTGELKELFDSYEVDADCTKVDWRHMSKTELANAYCDAEESNNIRLRDHFFSTLMCKYSYMVPLLYSRRESVLMRLKIEEFYWWVVEALQKGLKYRRWRNPEFKELYNNPNGAETVFNRCFYSVEKGYYKYYNQDCRKINYISGSLEDVFEVGPDGDEVSYLGTVEDPNSNVEDYWKEDLCKTLVQDYIDKGKVLQAVIIDGISYQDTFTNYKKSYTKGIDLMGNEIKVKITQEEFSPTKLVKHLNSLDDTFIKYFIETYDISKDTLKQCVNEIVGSRNSKLHTSINSTLEELRNNKELRECLCQ